MNNISTMRLPVVASLLVFLAASVHAQCPIITAPPAPVNVLIIVDQVNGTAVFNSNIANSFISTTAPCNPLDDYKIRLYEDQTKTVPYPWTSGWPDCFFGNNTGGSEVSIDQSHVNTIIPVWAAVNDGDSPLPTDPFPCGEYDPTSESAAVIFNLQVEDNTGPEAVAPFSVVVGMDLAACTASAIPGISLIYSPKASHPAVLAAGEWTDNCPANVSISYYLTGATNVGSALSPVPGNDAGVETFNPGVTTVTYVIEDSGYTPGIDANPVYVFFDVIIEDTEAPSLTCPPFIGANTEPGTCTAPISFIADALDNCGVDISWNSFALSGATITPDNGADGNVSADFPPGISFVGITATDLAGNSTFCATQIEILDIEPPVITCPADITVDEDPFACSYMVTGTDFDAIITENCLLLAPAANDFNFSTTLDGTTFLIGTTTVTWGASDESFNYADCFFSVTVQDITPPDVSPTPFPLVDFEPVIDVTIAPGACSRTVSWYRPSVSTHFVTDCSGFVSITENTTVSINCPGLDCQSDPLFFQNSGVTPFPYDANDFLHQTTPVTADFPVGTTVITYEFTDVYGNITPVTVTVNVIEPELPNAVCVSGITPIQIDQIGVATVPVGLINGGSSDNCGISSIEVFPPTFDCASVGTQNVTLTVTDNAGNTDDCVASVFVNDLLSPTIGCPPAFVVNAGPACTATVPSLIFTKTATVPPLPQQMEFWDNAFDPCGLTADYQVNGGAVVALGVVDNVNSTINLSGLSFGAGTNTVTLRLTDRANNLTACTFTVTVEDETGPETANCPANITKPANLGGCSTTATWTPPVWTDNCSAVTSLGNTHNPGAVFFFGPNVVSYTVRDASGNVSVCSFVVNVTDTQAPVARCKNVTATLNGMGSATLQAADIDNGSSDNCFFSFVSGPYNFNCSQVGTPQTIALTVSDAGSNTSSCTSVVTVSDAQAPVALCNLMPAALTLSPTDCVPPSDPGTVSLSAAAVGNSTDNCPGNVQYQISVDGGAFANNFSFNCSHTGARIVTLRASDSAGSSTCNAAINIRDLSAPCFNVPANIVLNCSSNPTLLDPSNTGSPSAIYDNCDGMPTVTYTDTYLPSPPECPNHKYITRTWTVADHATPPNSTTQSQSIEVLDNNPPVWTLATSFSLNTTGPTACTVPSPVPAVVVGGNVADECGGLKPITYKIDYPAGSGLANIPAGTALPANGLIPNVFPIGASTVTLRVSDMCGNVAQHTITVTVTDIYPPNFTYARCGQTYTLPNTTNACTQLYSWTRPSPLDVTDCRNFVVSESINNTSVQQFVNFTNPFNSWPPASQNVFAQFPVGSTTVTYTATDGVNASTCSFNVVIEDTQAPSIACPNDQILPITSGCTDITTVPNYTTLAAVTDNCPSNVNILQSPVIGSLVSGVTSVVPGNTFTVSLTARDNFAQNLSSVPCTFTVTLIDGESPIPDILALSPIISFCGKDTVDAPSATDCNGVSFETIYGTPSVPVMMTLPPVLPGGPPRYVLNAGSYVITWSYTDPQNNTTTQPQNVFIEIDTYAPVAICQSLILDLDANGEVTVNAPESDGGSYDQHGCGDVKLSYRQGISAPYTYVSSLDFNCNNLGNNFAVFAVTDLNNNTATCMSIITVQDVSAPEIDTPPADTAIQACAAIPPQASLASTDACEGATPVLAVEISTQNASNEFCDHYNYTITRNWIAQDSEGNVATSTQIITVVDSEAPVFSAPDSFIIYTGPNRPTCNELVTLNMLDYISDCVPDSELVVINSLQPSLGANVTGIYGVGTHQITFTATDKCGNSATKSVTIVVRDGTLPTAVCTNGISVSLQSGGFVTIGSLQVNQNSFDNCGIDLMLVQRLDTILPPASTITFDCNDADGSTQHPVKLFVIDFAGNEASCLTYVVVQDNVAPSISCPANKTIKCDGDATPAANGTATAADNCPVLPSDLTFSDAVVAGPGQTCNVINRTWSVKDGAGNMTTCLQTIALLDTVKPVLNVYPPDITISCSDPVPNPQNVTATDNCDQMLTVLFNQDTINVAPGVCGKYNYTIVRTRTVSDDCGNTEMDTRTITVVDTLAPRFLGMPDTVEFQTASFPPNNTCSLAVTFDAEQYFVECAPLGECTINAIEFLPAGSASVSPAGLDISGDYFIGSTQVIFTVTDPCGNVGQDSVVISITDNSLPTMVCNNNIVVSLGSNGDAAIDPSDVDLGTTDNCGIDTLFLSQTNFTCADLGSNMIRLTAVDIYGNSNFCEVLVDVTLGSNTGFSLTTTVSDETFFGASDGSVTTAIAGGTGPFTYVWSNNETTSGIAGLSGGDYSVVVTDLSNGCLSKDTVTVTEGPKFTLNVGDAQGCQGNAIVVPVTVDNFIAVSGLSLGLMLDNAVAGVITGLTDVNPALAGLTPGVNSVFWTNGNPAIGITLPNGTLLFNLNIQLENAPVGTTSSISLAALPSYVVIQPVFGAPVQSPMALFNGGTIEINCAAADIDIAGDITTWKNPVLPIPNVNVDLTGTVTDADVTALPLADYAFVVPSGANTTVTPTKQATAKSTKINVADLLFIQAHAAPPPVQIPFSSPYQWMAADINGDKNINIADYALVQSYIVNNSMSNGQFNLNPPPPSWKFVPKAYVFPVPNPLNPAPPSSIVHNNAIADFPDDDFIGVLLGDVNGDVVPNFSGIGGTDFAQDLGFRLNNRTLTAGEIVTIPFRAANFNNLQAYQFTISFDPGKLDFQGATPGVLTGISASSFGTNMLDQGLIGTAWTGGKAETYGENDVLFYLTFRVIEQTDRLSDVLRATDDIAARLAVDGFGNTSGVDLEFSTATSGNEPAEIGFTLFQNQPNPFSENTAIRFRLPAESRARLNIYSAEGRLVRTIIGDYASGMNTVVIRKDELGQAGVYWYELETAGYSDRKKLILID